MAVNTNFIIPKNGYLSFDALTMKQFIQDRLNETGIFTDQNYSGSFLSTIIEIIAYAFNVHMYTLNKTSTESMFSESQVYENMSRIVKLLDYKPIGIQTSTLTFNMSADSTLNTGMFTIPRYSYIITKNSLPYSFNEDIVFVKNTALGTAQSLDDTASQKLLYEGKYKEYPLYTAIGDNSEIIYLAPGDNVLVDHFSIDVYVKPTDTGIWTQYKKVNTLYLENGDSKSFEIRLNENKRYELKFGNNINGKKLNAGDKVSIYYLSSDGSDGEIIAGDTTDCKAKLFSTSTFDQILIDLNTTNNNELTYLTSTTIKNLLFNNTENSTYYQAEENVDSIRNNAPGIFRSQYRLTTTNDFENYIKYNFANLIFDAKAVNNWTYVSKQLKYYYDIGLKDPNNVSNVLYNQLHFADSCNFNNIYITVLPKNVVNTYNPINNLTSAQKELIITSLQDIKVLTSEIVLLDPIYMAVDLCLIKDVYTNLSIDDTKNTELYVIKESSSRRDTNAIAQDIYNVILNYFSRSNLKLGNELDNNQLTTNILSVDGVKTFYTRRIDDKNIVRKGLTFLLWNPIYNTDIQLTSKNEPMQYFNYLYFYGLDTLLNRITVESESKIYETIEF